MRNSTYRALTASVEAQFAPFRPVPLPVQITDETHPNIAAAIEWARKKKDAGNGND